MNLFDDELSGGLQRAVDRLSIDAGDAGAAMERGRRRRRAAQVRGGLAAVVLLGAVGGAALVVSGDDDPGQRVQVAEPDAMEEDAADDMSAERAESSAFEARPAWGGGGSGLPDANGSVSVVSGSWQVRGESDLGFTNQHVRLDDGTLFALSTAPGEHDWRTGEPERAIYRSTDGVTWGEPQLGGDFAISRLAARGNRLFALGTLPGGNPEEGRAFPAAVGWSDDGGANWTTVTLPFDLSGVADFAGDAGWASTTLTGLAEVDGGVVAVVTPSVWIDATRLYPELVDEEQPWQWTAEGLQTMVPRSEPPDGFQPEEFCGPDAEFVELDDGTPACDGPGDNDTHTLWPGVYGFDTGVTHTYAELGIADSLVELLHNRSRLFVIGDDGQISESALPGSSESGVHHSVVLSDTPDGALLQVSSWNVDMTVGPMAEVEHQGPDVTLFTSTDGFAWSELAAPPVEGELYLSRLTRLDGNLVAVAESEFTEVLVQREGSWTSTTITDLVEADGPFHLWASMRSVDENGLVFGVSGALDHIAAQGGADLGTFDGYQVRILDDRGTIEVIDDGGVVVARGAMWGDAPSSDQPSVGEITQDETGVIIATADDGTVTIRWEDHERAMEAAYSGPGPEDVRTPSWVVYSNNGIDWSVVALPEQTQPGHREVLSALLIDGQLVVRTAIYGDQEGEMSGETLVLDLVS